MQTPLTHLGLRLSMQSIVAYFLNESQGRVLRSNDGLPFELARPGATFGLQCLTPEEPVLLKRTMALHSVTYPAATSMPWPEGMSADISPATLEAQFGKPTFTMPGVWLFETSDPPRQITAEFDRATKKLLRLSFVHTGQDYGPVLAGTEDAPPAEPPPPPPPPPEPEKPAITVIRHGEIVPYDGYWKLGSDHPQYPFAAYRADQPPDPMFAGQTPSDMLIDSQNWRATLIWTWIKPLDEKGRKMAEAQRRY